MLSAAEIAQIRFGTGLSPVVQGATDSDAILSRVAGFDRAGAAWPIPLASVAEPTPLQQQQLGRRRREATDAGDDAALEQVEAESRAFRTATRDARLNNLRMTILRGATTEDGFRERLTWFWADHFTVRSKNRVTSHLVTPYVEEAVRPHVAGRFVDMLWAVVTHPMMLLYLDQIKSYGANSQTGLNQGRGLNENLARELLELHTLGVGADYTQTDVRELAELMTGLTYRADRGFYYDGRMAEPGAETVLGQSYRPVADLSVVRDVVEDIARHPDTAQHIARKIAVHFLADTPDEAVVAAMATRFSETDGDLLAVYETMLAHPAAFAPDLQKVKQPFGFVVSAFRALGVDGTLLGEDRNPRLHQGVVIPLRIMGQSWEDPVGPDGWPEEAAAWVTPQGMAGRIAWAMSRPEQFVKDLPDPRDFVRMALGAAPSERVVFAASAAESRAEGIGVVLASAAFQRR